MTMKLIRRLSTANKQATIPRHQASLRVRRRRTSFEAKYDCMSGWHGSGPQLTSQAERKRRKVGAAFNHAKMAEKLLAAQMRREAVRVAQE